MSLRAAAANTVWWTSNLAGWWAYRQALNDPLRAQDAVLRKILHQSRDTAFGREHRFDRISTYADFARELPIRDYCDFEPWVRRIRRGEKTVLTSDPVIRLATTSGTTSARKLIPYTRSLQAEFNRAIAPWIADLFHKYPSVAFGSAYWSISPANRFPGEESAVPIGFEEDSEYLGGIRRRLIDTVMAVPSSVRHAPSQEQWRKLTQQYLSRCKDLRLISIWHPSFITLLLDDMSGSTGQIWPRLKVISCWGDAHASGPMEDLKARFPGVAIQSKGLIATEAIVSIPFDGYRPLAIRSHFFEFLHEDGRILRAHELRPGQTVEVVVTNSGGLFRYRLHDRVAVDGMCGKTPSIEFLGKSGGISDRFGEKLSEEFVAGVLHKLAADPECDWKFSMLAIEQSRYVLFIEGASPVDLGPRLDLALRQNPNYAWCRDLGQLKTPGIFRIASDGQSTFLHRLGTLGFRLGDIKPTALSSLDAWAEFFSGKFIE